MKLTNLACKNAKPSNKPFKISDGGGLYLEVFPNGRKHWRFKYRFNSKENRIAFGLYPEVTLENAREIAMNERKRIKSGIVPSLHRKEIKRTSSLQAAQTFELVAREWHIQRIPRWSASHAKTTLYRLQHDVFPVIGCVPIKQLKAPDVLACVREIEKRGAHEVAKRSLQICGQILRYAVQTGRIEHNFSYDLRGALIGHRTVSFASIKIDELPDLIKTIEHNKSRLFRQTVLAIKLMMLTFVRTSELINTKWEEVDIDNKMWIIPANRMKMRRDHIVPLSKQSISILHELKMFNSPNGYIFPSIHKPRQPISNNTILKALDRLGYKGRMTGHGFRSLAMTAIKERLGYRHEVIDRQLAHAPTNKVDRAYDRAEFLDDRKRMMQEWADYVDGIIK
jgi:integrase